MWTVATYQPTSFFSLRPTYTTSSGGQTLAIPSPFAIKMALLDIAIRGWGLQQGQAWFPAIRDLQIALAGPPYFIINNTFVKIWRPKKNGPDDRDGTGLVAPFNSTIAFRAFVQYGGEVRLAVAPGVVLSVVSGSKGGKKKAIQASLVEQTLALQPPLAALLIQLNYLGKRGGFWQLLAPPQELTEILHDDFTYLTQSPPDGNFALGGIMQVIDDCAPHLKFAQVNVYDPTRLDASKDRVAKHVVLPYTLERSSRSYQLFRRLE